MPPSFRVPFQLLCWEAAFALAYESWIGPNYLSGLAGTLGVNVRWVSLFASAAWIGASAQLLSLSLIPRFPSIRSYTVSLAALARGVWLLPLCYAIFAPVFSPTTLFALLAFSALFAALLGSLSAQGWLVWTRSIVPSRFFGRFFGARLRYVMGAMILANIAGSFWVGWKPSPTLPHAIAGYGVLGGLAVACGVISWSLLVRVPSPRKTPFSPGTRSVLAPFRSPSFRGLLVYWCVLSFGIQLAGPFFPYWFTKELKIPMSSVALWNAATNLGCFLASPLLGRLLDRGAQDPYRFLRYATLAISFSPIPYLLAKDGWIQWIGPFEYFFNGFAWAGFLLASTNLLYRLTPEGNSNAVYFSVYSTMGGIAGALGNWLGGLIANADFADSYRVLWIVAFAVRISAGTLFFPRFNAPRETPAPS